MPDREPAHPHGPDPARASAVSPPTAAGGTAVAPAAGATALPVPVRQTSAARDLALVTTFAALVAVCAVLPALPTGGAVPITLQTFGVMLTGLLLGPRRAGAALALYVLIGLAGVPVLSGATGGLGVLAGPSAGYLLAFPLAAVVAGLASAPALRVRGRWRVPALWAAACAGSMLVVHPLGIAVLGWRLGLSAGEAVAAGAVFLPGDLLKNALAAVVAAAVLRAVPDLRRP